MRYKSIAVAMIAAMTSMSAFAADAQQTETIQILGDDISIVDVKPVVQPEPPVYPQQKTPELAEGVNTAYSGDLGNTPKFFVGIGLRDNRGINDNLDSEQEVKTGGSFHLGLQAEKWDVRAKYSTSSAEFNNVTDIDNIDVNAMYRAIESDYFVVKTGLGYDLMKMEGKGFEAFKDGKKETVDSLNTQSGYAAIDLSSSISENFSVGATVKYHLFHDDNAMQFSELGKAENIVDDISYDLRASYQVTQNVGVSLMTTFGSEFQNSSGIEVTLGF